MFKDRAARIRWLTSGGRPRRGRVRGARRRIGGGSAWSCGLRVGMAWPQGLRVGGP